MRTLILLTILLINLSSLFGQNSAPEVTNVTFNQRNDGSLSVDVYYDLNDADGDTMSVLMQVSDNNGDSWNFSCNKISGDIGAEILSGAGKHIVWDFGTEHPQTFGTQFRVKIIADDSKFETGTVKDIDGNLYQTVKIGEQWWMAENLKVTHYRNGDTILHVTDATTWSAIWFEGTGAWCNYNNDPSNTAIYGRLYNWLAVADSSNIAPTGWHVPNDMEWQTLLDYLGGENIAGMKMKSIGTIEGGDGLWRSPNIGATNSSGFTALPSGCRDSGGPYTSLGEQALFWSSSELDIYSAPSLYLIYDDSYVGHWGFDKGWGKSVRCVQD